MTFGIRVPFDDRRAAGRLLGDRLADLAGVPELAVLAIPRGGVPVAYEVALRLGAPLDVLIVRKLGLPEQPELAMGAIASGGVRVLNPEVAALIPTNLLEEVARREAAEIERRERLYRGGRAALDPAGRPLVLVDDGLATGASMKAAIAALRRRRPASITVAVPVSPTSTAAEIEPAVDRFECLLRRDDFYAVGQWYQDFSPTEDEEVTRLLAQRHAQPSRPAAGVMFTGAPSGDVSATKAP